MCLITPHEERKSSFDSCFQLDLRFAGRTGMFFRSSANFHHRAQWNSVFRLCSIFPLKKPGLYLQRQNCLFFHKKMLSSLLCFLFEKKNRLKNKLACTLESKRNQRHPMSQSRTTRNQSDYKIYSPHTTRMQFTWLHSTTDWYFVWLFIPFEIVFSVWM